MSSQLEVPVGTAWAWVWKGGNLWQGVGLWCVSKGCEHARARPHSWHTTVQRRGEMPPVLLLPHWYFGARGGWFPIHYPSTMAILTWVTLYWDLFVSTFRKKILFFVLKFFYLFKATEVVSDKFFLDCFNFTYCIISMELCVAVHSIA